MIVLAGNDNSSFDGELLDAGKLVMGVINGVEDSKAFTLETASAVNISLVWDLQWCQQGFSGIISSEGAIPMIVSVRTAQHTVVTVLTGALDIVYLNWRTTNNVS